MKIKSRVYAVIVVTVYEVAWNRPKTSASSLEHATAFKAIKLFLD